MDEEQSARELLQAGLKRLEITVTEEKMELYMRYLAGIQKWSRAYNLTAITKYPEMVVYHLLDALVANRLLQGHRFIDVGTGAGIPGIPLAIQNPEKSYTLLDSNGKKTRFLLQMKRELGLNNVMVVQSRAETYRPEERYDGILSRAFASLQEMVNYTEHLLSETGSFWAFKGKQPETEIAVLSPKFKVVRITPLQVPGLDAERHLIQIRK